MKSQQQQEQYKQMIQAVNERFRSKKDLHKYLTAYKVSDPAILTDFDISTIFFPK